MAKAKKKKTTHRHHRRARVSGIHMGKFNIMETVMSGVGLVVGTAGATMIQKYLTAVPAKAVSAVQLIGGVMFTQNKHPFVRAVAWGVAGAGAIGLAHQTGLLHGIDEMVSGVLGVNEQGQLAEYNPQQMSGMGNDTFLAGMPNGTTLGDVDQQPVMSDAANYVPVMGY